MPRPRKPTNVLELSGAFRKNPSRGRARSNEPRPTDDVGPPPGRLGADVTEAWNELVAMAHPGTLSSSDRAFMEYAAKVWLAVKSSDEIDPKLGIRFEAVIARLGMSPADRSRVAVRKPKSEENPFAEFAAR